MAGMGGPVGAGEEAGEVGGLVADEAGGMRPFTGDPRRAEDGGVTASRGTAAPASGGL
jgi:hypothetical protein